MVSQIAAGSPVDRRGRPFRRRRARPVIIITILLFVGGMIAWAIALGGSGAEAVPTDCNKPTAATPTSGAPGTDATTAAPNPSPAPPLTVVSRDDMLKVAPAPLSTFQVRVLNASSQRGAARSVADDLIGQGFNPTPTDPAADDPVYPNRDLSCVGQIRFGPAGKAAAAAVWLAAPCAQLVDDGRRGTGVDLALGEYHKGLEQSQDSKAALDSLRTANPKDDPKAGADPGVVRAVHNQAC